MKRYIKLFLIIAIITSFESCNDAIYVNPADEITDSNSITNLEEAKLGLIGVYASFSGIQEILLSSYISDELKKPNAANTPAGNELHIWNFTDASTDASSYYYGFYGVIARVNNMLKQYDRLNLDANQAKTLNGYRAELIGLRALCHFNLLKMFSVSYTNDSDLAISIIDKVYVDEKFPRNNIGEVINFIKADLENSKLLFVNNTNTSNIFLTKHAITAIQARVALYHGEFDNAIKFSNELKDLSVFTLAKTQSEFDAIWSDSPQDKETIFKLKRLPGETAIGGIYNSPQNTVYYNPSKKLTDLYSSSDFRLTTYFSDDKLTIEKYVGISGNPNLNDIKLFRISEAYLILAESYASLGNLTAASDVFFNFKKTRVPDFVKIDFTSKEQALDLILDERFREFAFEGHRFFDLKRQKRDIVRTNGDCDASQGYPCILLSTDHHFTLPIPYDELKINNTLIQNPGYTN